MAERNLDLLERLGFFIINHFWKFMLFCFIGFCSFLIDWGFFNIFYKLSSWFVFSIILSSGISIIFNFNANRNLTFRAKGFSVKKQFFRWLIIYGIAFLARIGLSKLILIILGENLVNANIAFLGGIAIAIPISFLGSLLWVFKKDHILVV